MIFMCPQGRPEVRTGYELWVGMAIAFYVIYAVTELITGLVHPEITLPLEFESDPVATLDFPEAEATLSGLTQTI